MDNYSYPAGADNSSAPWNQIENDELEFDVDVSVQLVKTMGIKTSDYFTETDTNGDDIEDFHTVYAGHDWEQDYENEHYTIPEMLEELKRYLESELPMAKGQRRIRVRDMLADCQGWEVEEFYAEES